MAMIYLDEDLPRLTLRSGADGSLLAGEPGWFRLRRWLETQRRPLDPDRPPPQPAALPSSVSHGVIEQRRRAAAD
jgi:hypothetical protein